MNDEEGTINLFTERLTCQSCTDVIFDFRREYPNITETFLQTVVK
ncbi:deaminase domain-containing protein [Paenibacillus aceti]